MLTMHALSFGAASFPDSWVYVPKGTGSLVCSPTIAKEVSSPRRSTWRSRLCFPVLPAASSLGAAYLDTVCLFPVSGSEYRVCPRVRTATVAPAPPQQTRDEVLIESAQQHVNPDPEGPWYNAILHTW